MITGGNSWFNLLKMVRKGLEQQLTPVIPATVVGGAEVGKLRSRPALG
jgi:hypothetical protein